MPHVWNRPAWVGFIAGLQVLVLAMAVDPDGLRAFTSVRWFLVSSLTAMAVALGGFAAMPRIVNRCWLFLVASMMGAAIVGVDPTTSWFGLPQRQLGVMAWAVFALAVHQGANLGRQGLVWLSRSSLVAALTGGVVVAVQLAGWDPFGGEFAGNRFGGLFGQPIIQGAVAVLLLPLVLVAAAPLAVRAIGALSLLAMIVTSQSRGAVVGMLAIALATVPTWWPVVRHQRRRVGAPTAAAIGLVGFAAISLIAISPMGQRLAETPASSRVDEWSLAVDVLGDSPLVGYGPEGYRIAVLDNIDRDYAATYGREVQVDRAHSAPLDVALAGGVLAGLAYVALLVALAVRVWRDRAQPSLATAAGVGAIAYFTTTLVAFPTPAIDTVAWVFAGSVLASGSPHRSQPFTKSWARAGQITGVVVLLVAAGAGLTDVIADRHMADADHLIATGHQPEAVESADAATELRPDMVDTWYVAAQSAAAGPSLFDLDAGLDRVESGLHRFPADPALNQLHTDLLVQRALRSEQAADIERAEVALVELARRDPTNPVIEFGTQSLARACLPRCNKTP